LSTVGTRWGAGVFPRGVGQVLKLRAQIKQYVAGQLAACTQPDPAHPDQPFRVRFDPPAVQQPPLSDQAMWEGLARPCRTVLLCKMMCKAVREKEVYGKEPTCLAADAWERIGRRWPGVVCASQCALPMPCPARMMRSLSLLRI